MNICFPPGDIFKLLAREKYANFYWMSGIRVLKRVQKNLLFFENNLVEYG